MFDLIEAYRTALYRVTGTAAPFVLRVGRHSAELEALHGRHGVDCSAFLTAWNPASQPTSSSDNEAAEARMTAELQRRGYAWFPGVGEDPSGEWREASVLVLGLARAEAEAFGRTYGQNAIVWSGPDAVPTLVLLR